jgi:hypothetical protein
MYREKIDNGSGALKPRDDAAASASLKIRTMLA